jgi:hypothetical protein
VGGLNNVDAFSRIVLGVRKGRGAFEMMKRDVDILAR